MVDLNIYSVVVAYITCSKQDLKWVVSCSVTEKHILGSSTKGERREARGEGREAK